MKEESKTVVNRFGKIRIGMVSILLFGLIDFFALLQVSHSAMSVAQSKHNLSVTGLGTIKAVSEGEICVFCHTPHKARFVGTLWNREDSTISYIPYQSTTILATVDQPTGDSRLCLSCHDGTIALGSVVSRAVDIQMTQQFLNTGPAALTNDLSDDHPISFVYDTLLSISNPEYRDPSLLIEQVTLDENNELQCTSCHDPHDDTNGKFLRIPNTFSALCLTCHQPTGWATSTHSLSNALWNSVPPDPWPHTEWTTVDVNGCENCHRSHSAGGHERLLLQAVEEDNCFPCHNGNVASWNVQSEFTKASIHPVSGTTGIHDPEENYMTVQRHVECADCHNPHQVNNAPASAPNVSGRLAGVAGANASGTSLENSDYEYEICFKCHGNSAQGFAPVPRQHTQLNKRLQLDQSNPSYHPVEGPGQNPNVPSLLPAYNTASVIYCTDCHNNDNGPAAGGTGPAGPHGSQNAYLLERQYNMIDNTPETSAAYALCYKCHDRTSILADQSFTRHNLHIVGQNTPCSVCHDPHGISSSQGNAVNNSHLINFDTSVVLPSGTTLEFVDNGLFLGTCTLVCHGRDHNPLSY